jgi:hypothetical protein
MTVRVDAHGDAIHGELRRVSRRSGPFEAWDKLDEI